MASPHGVLAPAARGAVRLLARGRLQPPPPPHVLPPQRRHTLPPWTRRAARALAARHDSSWDWEPTGTPRTRFSSSSPPPPRDHVLDAEDCDGAESGTAFETWARRLRQVRTGVPAVSQQYACAYSRHTRATGRRLTLRTAHAVSRTALCQTHCEAPGRRQRKRPACCASLRSCGWRLCWFCCRRRCRARRCAHVLQQRSRATRCSALLRLPRAPGDTNCVHRCDAVCVVGRQVAAVGARPARVVAFA